MSIKKILTLLITLIFLICLTACSSGSEEKPVETTKTKEISAKNNTSNSSNSSESTSNQPPITQGKDLDNLAIGDTATFDDYAVRVNAIEQKEGFLFASVTIYPKEDATFKDKYITAYTIDNKEIKNESADSYMSLNPGQNYTATLYYKDYGIDRLRWNNWSKEATWRFQPKSENNRNSNPSAFNDKPAVILAAEEQQRQQEEQAQAQKEAERQAQEAERQAQEAALEQQRQQEEQAAQAQQQQAVANNQSTQSTSNQLTQSNNNSTNEQTKTYILNTNTMKFHTPGCRAISKMKAENKSEYTGTRSDLIAQGYEPCGQCKPQ